MDPETTERLLEERQYEVLEKLCLRTRHHKETALLRAEIAWLRGDADKAAQLIADDTSSEAGNLRVVITGQGAAAGETRLAGLALERTGKLAEALALYEKTGRAEAQARVLVAMGTADSLRKAARVPASGPARTVALRRLAELLVESDGGLHEARLCVLLMAREKRLGEDDAFLCGLTLEGAELKAALDVWQTNAPHQPPLQSPPPPSDLEARALFHPEPDVRDAALEEILTRDRESVTWRGRYDAALAAARLGRASECLALLGRALSSSPHVPRLWLLAGLVAALRQPRLALETARCAAARFPEHFETLLLLARLSPDLADFLSLLRFSEPAQQARVWQALASRTGSERAANTAVRCAPLHADALFCAARSREALVRVLLYDPSHVGARLRLAELSSPELRRPQLQAVLRSDPRNARALALLGRLDEGSAGVAASVRSLACAVVPPLTELPADFTRLDA